MGQRVVSKSFGDFLSCCYSPILAYPYDIGYTDPPLLYTLVCIAEKPFIYKAFRVYVKALKHLQTKGFLGIGQKTLINKGIFYAVVLYKVHVRIVHSVKTL